MSTAFLLHRFRLRRAAPASTIRIDVCPPDVCPPRDSLWVSMLRWLVGNDAEVAPVLRTPLERARGEFVAALDGLMHVCAGEATDLLSRVRHARSLRELWHLRSELYTLIARRTSQPEADSRLARVNQHFPTRAQRSAIQTAEMPDAQ
jgi:hypothetical protein